MLPSDLSGDVSMGLILETLPGAKRALFARYHLGGCQSCAFSDTETLAELCQRSELEVGEVLAYLLQSHQHDLEMWISPQELKERLSSVCLVDVRSREEYESVYIENSLLFTQELQQKLFVGSDEVCYVLVDHQGRGVLDQVAWFRGHGLKQTFGLLGGIDGWSREIDPSLPRYRLEME